MLFDVPGQLPVVRARSIFKYVGGRLERVFCMTMNLYEWKRTAVSTDKTLWDSPGDKVGLGGEGSHIEHYSEDASGEGIQRITSAYFPRRLPPNRRPGNCTAMHNGQQ